MPILRPLHGNILVLPEDRKNQKTSSGLEISDSGPKDSVRGEVLAVGDGRQDRDGNVHPLAVKKGDIVAYQPHYATKVTDADQVLHVLQESDVLVVVEPDA